MVDYINLTVNLKVGTPELDGTQQKIPVDIEGNVWFGSFGAVTSNTYEVQLRYKVEGEEWTNWGNFSVIGYPVENKYSGGKLYTFPYDKSVTFQARAYDKVHQLTYGDELYTPEITKRALPVFEWGENDFNFNVPIKYLDIPQDFIVEEGSSGIWKYRKWYSGKAEAWGRYSLSTTVNTAWGSMFVGATPTGRIGYPFEFLEAPVEIASINCGNYAGWVFSESGGNGNNNKYSSGSYNVCRPTTGGTSTHTFNINLQLIGRWK
jgi:hypothetical protein